MWFRTSRVAAPRGSRRQLASAVVPLLALVALLALWLADDALSAGSGAAEARASDRSASGPVDPSVGSKLLAELGASFTLKQTPHFAIAYDTSVEFAEFHGELFEAVYSAFYDFFSKSGFPLHEPRQPLEAVLFDDRESFAAYARRRDPKLESAGGFYSTAENRVAFFDSFGDGEYRRLSDSVRQAEQKIRSVREEVTAMDGENVTLTFSDGRHGQYSKAEALDALAREERKIRGQRRSLRSYFKDRNLTTTIHECVHQLAFNLGVQDVRADNPKWLGEGLATYFETVGYRDTGPSGSRNPERLQAYREATRGGRPVALADLVRDDDVFSVSDQRAAAAYGESWALVQYLLAERPDDFFRYLQEVARGSERVGYVSRPDRLETFKHVFGGDLVAFENDWRKYMDRFP